MEQEAFDSFISPQFVDFTLKHKDSDESADAFFDIYDENRTKSQTESAQRKKSSADEDLYLSILHSDSCAQNEADPLEICNMQANKRYNLRKSMSIGNLVLFSEEEKSRPNLNEICENQDCPEENLNEKNTCVSKNPTSFGRNSNPNLNRKGSQDFLNKLSQPKRYTSVENLPQAGGSKYVSFAEAVNKFQNRTPERFRTKPNISKHSHPFTRTVPESPLLQTRARSRPDPNILSHEEKEQIEFENQQKFKIKANPVNKRILKGPLKPMAPVEKKAVTILQPFKLTAPLPKKVIQSPKKYEFHARPIPRSAEKPHKTQENQRRENINPVTPSFMKNYRLPEHKLPIKKENDKKDKEEKPRTVTKPEPFSFEHRDKDVQKKREEAIRKIWEEQRRAREFHAKPIPKSIYYRTGDSTKSDSGSSVGSSQARSQSSDVFPTQFKAREALVLKQEPFFPKPADKPPTKVEPFQLESDLRYYERVEFDKQRRMKEERLELVRQLEEEKRLKEEQEEIARHRKESQYKANPIRQYKELIIQPCGKVTVPVSPNFRKGRNKENISDNSFASF